MGLILKNVNQLFPHQRGHRRRLITTDGCFNNEKIWGGMRDEMGLGCLKAAECNEPDKNSMLTV